MLIPLYPRGQQEQNHQLRAEFLQQITAKEAEIRELEDLRTQLVAKEENEERLVSERDNLASRLAAVEHKLATYQSTPLEEQQGRIQELTARESQLSRELQERVGCAV